MKNNKIIKNIVNEIIDKIQSCNLELNKIYEFNLGNMSHCNMSHEEMINHYKNNSSPLSFLIEKILPKWFDKIIYDTTPHEIKYNNTIIKIKPDLKDKKTKSILYDQKSFNLKGGSFKRSSYKGIGRKYNKELNEIWAKNQIFIWTDVCELPKIKIIALTGEECLKRFPKCDIKYNEKDKLFNP